MIVTVTDVNDNAPSFDRDTDEVVIAVRSRIPVRGFYTATATDADSGINGEVTYSLSGSVTQFSIDPNSGIVSMETLLPTGNYQLIVTARDEGGLSTSMRLQISLVTHGRCLS